MCRRVTDGAQRQQNPGHVHHEPELKDDSARVYDNGADRQEDEAGADLSVCSDLAGSSPVRLELVELYMYICPCGYVLWRVFLSIGLSCNVFKRHEFWNFAVTTFTFNVFKWQ